MSLSGKEVFERLVRGSDELNRMMREIKLVAGMLMSQIPLDQLMGTMSENGGKPLCILGEKCQWTVTEFEGKVFMECFANLEPKKGLASRPGARIFSRFHENYLTAEYAQMVYESLPALVSTLMDEFLTLEDQLRPFLEAGKPT
jgi:hypothetical protein